MKIKAQAKLVINLLANGMARVTVYHGRYYRENKPEDYVFLDSLTMPQTKLQDLGILLPIPDAS